MLVVKLCARPPSFRLVPRGRENATFWRIFVEQCRIVLRPISAERRSALLTTQSVSCKDLHNVSGDGFRRDRDFGMPKP